MSEYLAKLFDSELGGVGRKLKVKIRGRMGTIRIPAMPIKRQWKTLEA